MPSIFKPLLIMFTALTSILSFGQIGELNQTQEVTFLSKVKFANIFIAGLARENLRACNGDICGANEERISMAEIQKLKYKKAKVLTVGYCEIEMIIDSVNLRKYQIVTKRAKETERLVREILRQFGAKELKTEITTWTTKSLNGEIIISQFTVSPDKETGNFISWLN